MIEDIDLEQLNLLHPSLRPYVKILLTHEIGLLKELPKIHSIQCGNIIKKNQLQYGDRFHLRIMYGRKPLNWQILMNGNDVRKAPDFIFEENFLPNETENTIKLNLPSLVNWDPSNMNSLLNVVLELLKLYKSYQINLLRSNSRLNRYLFEYETLVSMTDIDSDDIEVCIHTASRSVTVLFIIQLNVDFTRLSTALPNCKKLILLMVEFKENGKNNIQLMPRIEVENDLGSCLEIPDLPHEISLMDYVPQVENILLEKVEKIIKFTHQRKLLYSHLVRFFEPALISGDNVNYRSVSFLLEHNNFSCILNVHIPQNYSENQLSFQLLPFQFQKMTNPRASDYNNYSYEASMSPEQVAKNVFNYVKEVAITEFQKNVF